MDQVEGEAGHPQPLEPGPIQVSHEKPAAIGQTEDEKNRARQIQEPTPQWPGRVLQRVFAPTSERRGPRGRPPENPQTSRERTGKRNRDAPRRIGRARGAIRGRTHNPWPYPLAPNDGGSPTRRT